MSEKVIFTNSRGQSVELTNRQPFLLEDVVGKGDVEAEIQMQKSPYQDGSTYIDSNLQPRPLSLLITIFGDDTDSLAANRQLISSIFNPKLGLGRFVYEKGNTRAEIYGVSEHVPTFPVGSDNKGLYYQKAIVDLICPNPYWQDINPTNVKLEDYVANFAFPFSFPVSFATRGDTRTLTNNGHVPTPVKVTFVGESVNPKITKVQTGEFIKVNRTIPTGYSLVIDTSSGNKSVEIVAPDGVATNALGYIDLDSSFFSLDVGNNQLSFITEGGQPDVYIEYKNLFVGV